jgi:hypothetical protein
MLAVGEMGSMKEMEIALADPTQAKVSATTANRRNHRGLIFCRPPQVRRECEWQRARIPDAKMTSQYR